VLFGHFKIIINCGYPYPAVPKTEIFQNRNFLRRSYELHHYHGQIKENFFLAQDPAASSSESPYSVAAFVINSELHTGARPSARVFAGLII